MGWSLYCYFSRSKSHFQTAQYSHSVHQSLIHANRLKRYAVRDVHNPRLITRPDPDTHGDLPPRATIANTANDINIPTQSSDTGNDATQHSQSHSLKAPRSNQQPIAPSTQASSRPLPGIQHQLYTVDRILECKTIHGIKHYRIKWVGYSQTSWEPATNLNRELIRQFHLRKTLSGKARKHGFKYLSHPLSNPGVNWFPSHGHRMYILRYQHPMLLCLLYSRFFFSCPNWRLPQLF
jgi:hypothetical protein